MDWCGGEMGVVLRCGGIGAVWVGYGGPVWADVGCCGVEWCVPACPLLTPSASQCIHTVLCAGVSQHTARRACPPVAAAEAAARSNAELHLTSGVASSNRVGGREMVTAAAFPPSGARAQ